MIAYPLHAHAAKSARAATRLRPIHGGAGHFSGDFLRTLLLLLFIILLMIFAFARVAHA